MNHPELLAVPALMIVDFVLTIVGAKSAAVAYRKHFVIPSYEMNPLWRKTVDRYRWFNPLHITIVALFTLFLVAIDQLTLLHDNFELVLGMLLGAFGVICGRHLTNLLLFHYVNRHPTEIAGQVQLSMKLTLKMSQFTYMGLIPVFVIVAAFAPHRYTIGVLLGLLVIILAHFIWGLGAKPTQPPSEQVVEAELADEGP